MFALRVRLNDEEPVIGGADDLGVINAHVTGVGMLGPLSIPARPREDQEFFYHLGGLTARETGVENEHVNWVKLRHLKVGDKVTIEIIETDSANPIVESTVSKHQRKNDRNK